MSARQAGIDSIRRRINDHNEAALRLEVHANSWFRASKYAWLHAAFIHRHAARELTTVLKQIEIGIYEVGA